MAAEASDFLSPLRMVQRQGGAVFGAAARSPVRYGPSGDGAEDLARSAARSRVALVDLSDWTRLRVTGADRLTFLHNQTTNDFKSLQPGQGTIAAIVNATARPLDLATAWVTEAAVLLLASPGMTDRLLTWFDRFIFPMDRVEVTDAQDAAIAFSLIGPEACTLLQTLGIHGEDLEPHGHRQVELAGIPVRLAAGSGLAQPGFTLWVEVEDGAGAAEDAGNSLGDRAATLWQTLTAAGAVPLGSEGWERLRVEDGRPWPGAELTEDFNALEAGLWGAVSFQKGCYIGQETIARLDTYDGVKQYLYGFRFDRPVAVGADLFVANPDQPDQPDQGETGQRAVGRLTSVLADGGNGAIALGYLRRKAGGPDTVVTTAAADGTVATAPAIALPFISYGREK
ncbi:MAG: folate-binding protein [Cyanobacteria bacterium]|nr:folate-binding protein [Cyanobacteriota bacterium]